MKPHFILACTMVALFVGTTGRKALAKDTVLRTFDVDRKVDTQSFTGTIDTITLAKFSLIVVGHEIIQHKTGHVVRREPANTPPHKDPPRKTPAPPKDSAQTFRIDPACKITIPEKITGMISDFHEGDTVTVKFNTTTGLDGKTERLVTELTLVHAKK